MNDIDEFLTLVRDEIGLPVTSAHAAVDLDQVPGWDSVHLLSLLAVLERETGRRVPLPAVLEAPTLGDIYTLAVGG
ncbi:acyl carrier protein [Streptomyces sp. NBC_01198]|uniref:acyl carrier protein n=1 Tax=Streptomyces sp. NBC_01198 TaxID=2903769 RepID=UPI002E0FCB70|nr:acyl carrier protein [Streptomyces sp. NBC_01198]